MQDLRLAVRALRATPVVTTVALLSLALGIGANTAIFSLVNTLLLRSLPVADPQRLALVASSPSLDYRPHFSYATFEAIRSHVASFDGALAWSNIDRVTLTIGADLVRVDSQFVSGDYFTTLGVPAWVGRTFSPTDDVMGGGPDGPVGVISHRLWEQRFGGALDVIGDTVAVERVPVTIVGVAPPAFFGVEVGRAVDLLLPVRTQPLIEAATPLSADSPWLNIMLRLKPGQSLEGATGTLRAVQPQIRASAMPASGPPDDFMKEPLRLEPATLGTSILRERFERPLWMVFVVVALVLLIACANVTNLMLARGATRRHELSVRLALGASRWRLARQFLAEASVLAAAGTLLGFVFALWASRVVVSQLSTSVTQIALDLSLDWRVLAFTAATMISAAVVSGVAPALRATRLAAPETLKQGGRSAVEHRRTVLSSGLIVAQIAISLILVVSAGLFVRTFEQLSLAPLGFDRDRVMSVTVTAPTIPAPERNHYYHRLVDAVAAVPGVAHAGGSLNPPLIGFIVGDLIVGEAGSTPRPDSVGISQSDSITPGWLEAYGTPIRAGRDIDPRDTTDTPPVMLVNEAFVRQFLPDRSPVGVVLALAVRVPPSGTVPLGLRTIVGVAGDAVWRSIRAPVRPTIYFPLAQRDDPLLYTNFYIAVRSIGSSPTALTRSVEAALTAVNPDLGLTFRPLSQQVGDALVQDRLVASLSGFFGVLALLLAGLGLYGVTSYTVTRQRAEIGIRMALGAAPARVVRLVLRRLSLLVGLGVILGIGFSVWAAKFVASLVYGLEPRDPATLVGAAISLIAVGGLAGWLPAYRAARIDPAETLRGT